MHDSSDDLATYLERQNRYTTLAARQAYELGRSAGVLHLALLAGGALLQVLHPAPGLPRRRAGAAAHLDRLHEQLHEVRQAHRAAQGGAADEGPPHRRRRLHRHACAQRLLERGDEVIGVDNLSPYYSVELKQDRLRAARSIARFRFHELDIADAARAARAVPRRAGPTRCCTSPRRPACAIRSRNPQSYIQTNLVGFANVLEGCRARTRRATWCSPRARASTATTPELPWSESDNVDHPISLYAATKKANELMAHVYSHLYGLHATGLRFFTVYGPWGRPDMSPMLFAKRDHGGQADPGLQPRRHAARLHLRRRHRRGHAARARPSAALRRLQHRQPPAGGAARLHRRRSSARSARRRKLEMKPMQPGDVKATYADTTALRARGRLRALDAAGDRASRASPNGSGSTTAAREGRFLLALLAGCTVADTPYPLDWDPHHGAGSADCPHSRAPMPIAARRSARRRDPRSRASFSAPTAHRRRLQRT